MLNNKKQGLKMQAIHDLLQDSLLRAEDYRLGMQAEQRGHANLVLNKVWVCVPYTSQNLG